MAEKIMIKLIGKQTWQLLPSNQDPIVIHTKKLISKTKLLKKNLTNIKNPFKNKLFIQSYKNKWKWNTA